MSRPAVSCSTSVPAPATWPWRSPATVGPAPSSQPTTPSRWLTVARSKLRRVDDGDSVFPLGVDALNQPFADRTFDCVAQAFVIRNVADPARELAEILRVLKPGGTMVVLELVSRRRNLLSPLADAWTERVIPLAGRFVAGDGEAYRYLVASARTFHTAHSLARAGRGHRLRRRSLALLRDRIDHSPRSEKAHLARRPPPL